MPSKLAPSHQGGVAWSEERLTSTELSLVRYTKTLELLEGFLSSLICMISCQFHEIARPTSLKSTTYMSQVLVLALALSDEVVELRRKELGGHGGLWREDIRS